MVQSADQPASSVIAGTDPGAGEPESLPRSIRKAIHAFSCAVSEWTVALFADSRMVLLFVILSIGSAVFTIIARTELALTLFLSILALAITAAILFVGERRETVARSRDEAMHAKLDSLLRGVADADEALAGSERSDSMHQEPS